MAVSIKKIILFLFSCTLFSTINAQRYLFDVQIINVEDGLPDRRVGDIVQDKEGFLWISTQGKISRYDGYEFKTYNANFLNIPEYAGVTMAFDQANNLWYSVRSAASEIAYGGVLNNTRDSVYTLEAFTNNQFKSKEIVYINRSAVIKSEWFITTLEGKIYKYNGTFEEIYHYPKYLTNDLHAQQHSDGSYWVFHENEIIKIVNESAQKVFHLPFENGYPMVANSIIQFSPPLLIKSYHPVINFNFFVFQESKFIPYSLPNYPAEEIADIFYQTQDYTVFATKKELIVQDTNGSVIYRFDEFEDKSYGEAKIKCNSVLLDNQNNLWLGTENGLIKITQKKNPFTQLLPKNSTRGIYLDTTNQLWVGGYKGNIQRNLNTTKETVFFESSSLGRPPVIAFHKDLKGHLWVGTTEPLLLEYIPGEATPKEYKFKKRTLLYTPFENPFTKTLWVGTNNGLLQFDRTTKQFIPYSLPIANLNIEVRQFYLNQEGLWIITSKGIFLVDKQSEKVIKHYSLTEGLPNENINHLYDDTEGIFWLASKGGGLIQWDKKKNKFTQFNQAKGLSNNTIYAVYEDDYERLWLPSNYGLMCFDKNTLTTKVYLPQNGIAHEEFNTFSHFESTDGTFYFGGLNGITSFHPKDMMEDETDGPPLYVTKIRTLEEDQEEFTHQTAIFQRENKIILNPNNRILELELSLLDFAQSAKHQYAYQIDGYQDQWIYTRENKISLINLPYGNYTLKLKGRGATGNWSNKELSIPLIVKKPFYIQWYFLALCLLFLVIIVYATTKWRIANLEKDRKRLEAEVKKRTSQIEKDKTIISEQAIALQELDKAKTRFFSNITHEFRTPLTLIIGPLQQMIKSPKTTITTQRLTSVLYNAQNILKLINQLLDISKLEGGKMKMEVTRGNIIAYTQKLIDGFTPLAYKKNHRFIFLTKESNWVTHFDGAKWDKIIYNLVFNAIKFTPQYGVIQIALRKIIEQDKEWIYLKVRDSGIGINKRQLSQIFNRFYQGDSSTTRVQEGTGIGLSLVKELVELQGGTIKVVSKLGKGTTFEVKLPVYDTSNILANQTMPKSLLPTISFQGRNLSSTILPPSSTHRSAKLKLLIIEDNKEMCAYIQSCVSSEKYVISTANNGVEGIEKAQNLIPDLIISDVMMPLKDGFEVTQTIRNQVATSHIPIILLTAKAALENKLKGIKRGADVYLTKPFSPEELTLRIQKLIEIRQVLQDRYNKENLLTAAFGPTTSYENEDIFITRLRSFINQHLNNTELNGHLISKNFRISRMQLHRKLKALTNQTTTEFIQSIRLEVALELLKEKKLNVSEVAFQTGFNSLTHFTRKFKKKYQITPSKVLK